MRRALKWAPPAPLAGTIILTRAGVLDGRAAVGVAIDAEVLLALVAGRRWKRA